MDKQVVISFKTILLTFAVALVGYVVFRLGSVIGIFAVATLLVIAMESVINYFMRLTVFNKPLKRGVAVLISYGLLLLVMIVVGTVGLPPVIAQFQKMIAGISQIAQGLNLGGDFSIQLKDFLPQAANVSSELLSENPIMAATTAESTGPIIGTISKRPATIARAKGYLISSNNKPIKLATPITNIKRS